MTQSLFDQSGTRKYLVARERLAFVSAAVAECGAVGAFCLALVFTGARIFEVLALGTERMDMSNEAIVFETLKQRKRGVFRAVPVPRRLIELITLAIATSNRGSQAGLWPWNRTMAWKQVKRVMKKAGVAEALCKPKALRHSFAIDAGQHGVPLNIVQRWLGHARLETTAIYAGAMARKSGIWRSGGWKPLEAMLPTSESVSADERSA